MTVLRWSGSPSKSSYSKKTAVCDLIRFFFFFLNHTKVTLFVPNCLRRISFKKKLSKIFRVKADLLRAVCDLLAKYSRLVYGQKV